jgi:transglutaminase-like putative cysteine protease
MKISIEHTTRYVYETPVRYSTQYLRLVPSSDGRQRVIEWRLDTPGNPVELTDGYGNTMHVLTIVGPVSEIAICSSGTVETSASQDEPREEEPALSPLLFLRASPLTQAAGALSEFAEGFRGRTASVSGLRGLAEAVLTRLPFKAGETSAHSTAVEAFATECGVCQDHAHVFIACCRHLGVPARYVSGYLHVPDSAEAPVASHAWAEAWVVDRWRSFDITNARPAGERHIKLAIGADYLEASPVRGVRRGGGEEQLIASALVIVDPQK